MAAVQRTIEQVIADAWGNDEGGVTVHVLEEGTHLEVQRALTPDEARAFAAAIILAADAVEQRPGEPPAPRGDAITASGHRRVQDVAKTPQIVAEAQQPEVCGGMCSRPRGHADAHHPTIRW
ncbi:hypothetical protein [Clavibacter sp. VKM Ac-2872]|uniref:hypothetical protein n=1 Tax=Clavibacter sp. VKM Ac-2872 TaxID=2783812 RepID=UPI00188CFD2B|nr:hypothetical protein [Clavibacter sp. VKM Ac-2872]MBF4625522.1 hypothetical protein [Clavibacter sp. VKM Ac-2872]